ncbi:MULTISPECIES: hypothetical protein [Lonsdalea]|uniref:Uncharacterized protein n=2 Tax=Lonsdalea TaxID=1082702 RepID=A0ACD1JA29_9GAMM|nr:MULTISPECIES: hypothetical protein [Lonsdalea]RAT11924.1 hypothetical protein AU485_12960 [Lonsdalea quercina]RAT19765.1 hypothetical protein AU487_10000 [Lonsdalea populi]RAT22619.1 hypothetical protein AU488_11010 [Lonsdalea populi]RAT26683.1 hypothetical protein AU489_04450 [Lonsdalea populi]RAT34725.1 hypothetical protein AU492_07855 [Lonsdalea populi]
MNFTFAFLVVNYLLLVVGRLYQFDENSFFYMHYSTMLPLIWVISPISTLVFICSRHRLKWRYAGGNILLHVFTALWINYIGPISAAMSFGSPTIVPVGDNENYVVFNAPKGQQAIIDLVMLYFKQHPFDKNQEEFSAVFKRKSIDTPINGKRPLAHWWNESMTGPSPKYIYTGDYEITAMTYFNKKNHHYLKELTRFWFNNGYRKSCAENENNIVDIKSNGSQDPTCD